MKIYILWCFDHGTPNMLGVYSQWIDAERECNRLEVESTHDETFWLHYSVTEHEVNQPQKEMWREFT